MKKLLFLSLLFSSAVSYADLAKISVRDNVSVYIDVKSIQVKKNIVKLIVIVNETKDLLMDKERLIYKSTRSLLQYDCKRQLVRGLSIKLFTESMGEGTLIHQDKNPYPYEPIKKGSLDVDVMNEACKKV